MCTDLRKKKHDRVLITMCQLLNAQLKSCFTLANCPFNFPKLFLLYMFLALLAMSLNNRDVVDVWTYSHKS